VEHNSDHSYTASVHPVVGDADIRAFTSAAAPADVATECSSLAAHGPDAPVCSSGETGMCGHITLVTASELRQE
jgi:hypothetical protein